MVENRLVNFDQKTGGKSIAFGLGETPQGMDVVAFSLRSQITNHRWTDAAEIDGPYAKIPQEMIVLNITQNDRIARFGGILLQLKEHGPVDAEWYLEQLVH